MKATASKPPHTKSKGNKLIHLIDNPLPEGPRHAALAFRNICIYYFAMSEPIQANY